MFKKNITRSIAKSVKYQVFIRLWVHNIFENKSINCLPVCVQKHWRINEPLYSDLPILVNFSNLSMDLFLCKIDCIYAVISLAHMHKNKQLLMNEQKLSL